jgi:hypothetical protein
MTALWLCASQVCTTLVADLHLLVLGKVLASTAPTTSAASAVVCTDDVATCCARGDSNARLSWHATAGEECTVVVAGRTGMPHLALAVVSDCLVTLQPI